MAKIKAPSIINVIKEIKKGKLLPLYYFFGEDMLSINSAVKSIEEALTPRIISEFDKEKFYGESNSLNEVLDIANAFPFGSDKKLLIYKQFEKVKDKKPLINYASSPAEFTVFVIIHNGTITNLSSEPYKTLLSNSYLYEAKELSGKSLIDWIQDYIKAKGKIIKQDNAQVLIDIVGENRSMLEDQLEKICVFLNKEKEISIENIQQVSSQLKQFNIFDLQNAIGVKDKAKSISIANNLLDNGAEPIFIIAMLTRYFTGLAKVKELRSKSTPDQVAARIVGTHPYYFDNYVKARNLYSDSRLVDVFRALLNADVSTKTSSLDGKTIVTILISEILN